MIAVIIILALLIIITVLIMTPMYLNIIFEHSALNQHTEISIKYMWFKIKLVPSNNKKAKRLFIGRKNKSDNKKTDESKEKSLLPKNLSDMYSKVTELWDDICDILAHLFTKAISVDKLDIRSEFGFKDPMTTGIMTGVFNGCAYNALSAIDRNTGIKSFDVNIKPNFDVQCIDVSIDCIIKIKNVHIIVVICKALKILIRENIKGTKHK